MTMRLKMLRTLSALALLAALTPAAPVTAQPAMPDLRTMSGKPLPVPDLPAGTVVVRLARQTPANAIAGVEITASTRGANGDLRTRTAKTGADGRATFEGIATGSEFQAQVTVDGERLETTRFSVPAQGGTRVMLIAGLASAPADGDPHAGAAAPRENFRMGAPTGQVEPAADLPKGTLELALKGSDGAPLVGRLVRLGQITLSDPAGGGTGGREVTVHDATTDREGRVRYTNLTTGETAGYAAVSEHEGSRISTVPFRMPADGGMRGTILALQRTRDLSALQLDSQRTRIVVDLREEALAIMIALSFRNRSRAVFEAGDEGIFIPFPEGAVNAQEIEGGEPIEIVPGKGVRFKGAIPPDSGAQFATEIRYGYILPADGAQSLEVKQVLPLALDDPFLIVPGSTGLRLEGPGVKPLRSDKDGKGDQVNTYTTSAVPAGGALTLTVTNIPGRDRTGRTIAAVLCLAFIAGAVVLGRGAKRGAKGSNGVRPDDLVDKREQIFAELVAIERQRQAEGANPRLDERRRETVARLESVYRELARID